MYTPRPRAAIAAILALLAVPALPAGAQTIGGHAWAPPPPPPPPLGSFNTGGFIIFQEPPVVRELVIVHDQPAPQPAAVAPPPPPAPRKPYVIGRNYSSLPSGCTKLIEDGGNATYFYCGGEWYRQVGASQYRAVGRP